MKRLFVVICSLILIVGCAEAPPVKMAEREIVWPLPPDKPRIKYIGSYNNTFDVEDPPGFFDKIAGREFYRLEAPQGVVADRKGNIYVADSTRHVVVVFKPAAKKLDLLGHKDITERVGMPIGLALAPRSNMLFVASTGTKKVIAYDLNTGLSKFVIAGFNNPVSVAVDETRARIYVTDSKDSELKAFDMSGRYISTIAKRGSENHQLAVPNQVTVDKQGNIYVADIFNFRIKVFSPDGRFLKAIGTGPCVGFGCFSKVNGVALDSDNNIYGVDIDTGNIQIFNQDGELLLVFGGYGSQPGRLQLPMHIYIDENDRIYVADSHNSRVNVYQYIKYSEK